MENSLETVVNIYRVRVFQVTLALMDNQFRPLEGNIPVKVQLNTVSADDHVGLTERYIRKMKERSWSVVSVLPFEFLPRSLLRGIVESRNFWLNSFPRKEGILKVYSPRTIILEKNTDYNKHCQLETGQYVKVHEKSDNTMKTRTKTDLYLHPSGNDQGGGYFMKIDNG